MNNISGTGDSDGETIHKEPYLFPEESLQGKELIGEDDGIYLLLSLPDDIWKKSADEAFICTGNGLELALGWTMELNYSYILFRSDLRNPGVKIILYIKKNSNTQEKFQKLKEKYFRPLIYMTDTEDGREIFPIGWAGTCSVKELELKVLRMLRTHPETKECFVHCVNEQQGLSLLREMTRYSVGGILGDSNAVPNNLGVVGYIDIGKTAERLKDFIPKRPEAKILIGEKDLVETIIDRSNEKIQK